MRKEMGWGWRFLISFLSIMIPVGIIWAIALIMVFNGGGPVMMFVALGVQVLMPIWAPPYLRKVDSWL